MDKSARWQLVCLSLAALGWLTSGYLLLRLLRLGKGETVGADVCSALGGGCDWTLMSPASWQLGIPLPVWGLLYFALLAFVLVLASPTLIQIATFLAAGGLGASLVLSFRLLQSGMAVCYFCLIIHALNVSLFLCLVALNRAVSAQLDTAAHRTSTWSKSTILCMVMACALGGLTQVILLRLPISIDRGKVLADYLESPIVDLAVDADDPIVGSADAPIRLVVFSSFQCPGCRQFAFNQEYLEGRFGAQLKVVFKHFPLSSKCNASVSRDLQPAACAAAHAAAAARLQNAFWPYHDHLFAIEFNDLETNLRDAAMSAELDIARWDADRNSDRVSAKIRRDTELGTHLGINETPSIFLNGRRVRPFNLGILEFLIEYELSNVKSGGLQ